MMIAPVPNALPWNLAERFASSTMLESEIRYVGEPEVVSAHTSDIVFLDTAGSLKFAWLMLPDHIAPRIHRRKIQDTSHSAQTLFKAAMQRASNVHFEDGMESAFSRELDALVRAYSKQAVGVLGSLLVDGAISPNVYAETLRWIGHSEDALQISDKASLLSKGLCSANLLVRDSAALGFASLDDPIGIEPIQKAIENELNAELKSDMEQVLKDLKNS